MLQSAVKRTVWFNATVVKNTSGNCLPSALPNIVCVTCDRFLGILTDCNFKFCKHVDIVV